MGNTNEVTIVARILTKVDDAEAGINKLKNSLSKLKVPDGIDKGLAKSFTNLEGIFERYRNQLNKGFKTKGDVSAFAKTGKELETELSKVSKYMTELTGKSIDFKVNSEPIRQAEKDLENLIERQQKLANTALNFKIDKAKGNSIQSLLEGISKEAGNTKAGKAANAAIANLQMGDVSGARTKIEEIIAAYKRLGEEKKKAEVAGSGMNIAGAATAIKKQLDTATSGLQEVKSQADQTKGSLDQMRGEQLGQAADQADKLARDMAEVDSAMSQANKSAQDFAGSTFRMSEELNQLKTSTQYFFGLRNMINLLKQGLREAVQTIKDLDAAMTETAVVTDFRVGDMWNKLPQYTANANALGASIQDMYESTTLYYQQGLDTEQSMSIAAETMKMARIAGLEAKDATDMMTAALRGFNMELNETSAKRINDVFSELAAVTASDTEEIGSAMQRTASIAANAGMSFEGTATFLAQAIETTREPAENIGTAMKTIIARMQEMKKNPLEIGEVDGEEVDYNKIDAALKSVGISIKKANGDFRDNDEVLLDISKHWNSLSQTQQRYIATTVAGSRQQSRFIAMVGNYERTQELLNYANNSEGASDTQFGKTLDSLEAKITQFQNAWKTFLMNIMNDSWTKKIVSGTTDILNVVNKLINTLSFGNKGIKSALSLVTAFTALKMTGKGANMLIGGLGGLVDPSSSFKEGFRNGALGGQAGKITSPIVKAIYDLVPHIDRATANEAYKHQGYGNYKAAQKELAKELLPQKTRLLNGKEVTLSEGGSYSINGVNSIFDKNQLNKEQQKALLSSMPGLKKNMTKALASLLQDSGADPKTAKGLIAGFKKGQITSSQVLEKSGLLGNTFSEHVKKIAEEQGEDAAHSFARAQRKTLSKEEVAEVVSKARNQGKTGQEYADLVRQGLNKKLDEKGRVYGQNPKVQEALNATRELSKSEKAANVLNGIGSAATSAGMSLQMFGAQLSVTNPIIGEAITKLGSLVTMLGTIPNTIGAIVAGGAPVIGLSLALAAVGSAYVYTQIQAKRLVKAADEVQKSFEDSRKETEANLATLKQYQTQAEMWSKGVDAFGNNINLSDSDYAEYTKAIDEIAKMNPKIVQGYNAQGHAIVNINKALSETIQLQKQRQKEEFDAYMDPASLDKIIKARNVNDDFQKATRTYQKDLPASQVLQATMGPLYRVLEDAFDLQWDDEIGKFIDRKFDTNLFSQTTAPFADKVTDLTKQLKEDLGTEDLTNFLEPFNIDWDKLAENDETEIRKFVQRRNDIYSAALQETKGQLSSKFTNIFQDLDTESEGFTESISQTLQWLQTYIGTSKVFETLPEEIKSGINQGLENIAIQPNLEVTEMQDQADLMIQQFEDLTRRGGEYATAMEEVEKAQDEFASSLDASEYAKNTEGALSTLNSLLKEYEDDTTAYGQAVTEYLTQQVEKIKDFTEEGTISLTEALNTATNEIAAAEGAYEAFQDATKSDMSTGADNMKSIFEEITKETDGIKLHMQGKGDDTLWTGMSSLFSEDAVEKAADKGGDAVQNMLKRIEPMLQEGQAGFDAFWTDMFSDENYAKLKDIKGVMMDQENWEINWDDDLNPDVFHEMAEALGYSDQFLTSMLNKGRQFANLNFMDESDVRKALSTDEAAITGTSTSVITNDEGKKETVTDIFVKGDYLKTALKEANISNPAEQKEAIKNITKKGVKIIPNSQDITKKDFKNMGITDLSSLVRTLGDTGQFNRSEIEEYAQQMKDYNAQDFDTVYKDYLDSQEHPELPSINSIDGNVASIVHMMAREHGVVEQTDKDNYRKANELVYGEAGVMDSLPQLFSMGQNKNGENLSANEYKQTKKELEEQANTYSALSDLYEVQARKASEEGRTQDAQWFTEAAKDYDKMSQDIGDYIKAGTEAYKENKEKEENKAVDEKSAADKARDNQPTSDKERERRSKKEEEDRKSHNEFLENQRKKYDNAGGPTGKSLEEQKKDKDAEKAAKAKRIGELQAQQAEQQSWQAQKQLSDERIAQREKEVKRIGELQAQQAQQADTRRVNPVYENQLAEQNAQKRYEALSSQYSGLFNNLNIRPELLQSSAGQQAIAQLYSEMLTPNINAASDATMQALQTLGIDIEKAVQAGLVDYPKEEVETAVEQGAETTKTTGIQGFLEKYVAHLQEESEGIDVTDYLTPNGLFGPSLSQKLQEYLTPLSEILSGDNITIPDPNTGFVQKVKTSAEKLGQALKDGWDALNGNNVEPPSPSKKTVKSINEGGQAVVNAANEAINGSKSQIEVDDTQVEEADTKVEDLTSKVNEGGTYNLEVKGQQDITKSAAAAQKLSKVTGKENKIKVTADKVDTSSVKQAKSDIAGTEAKLPVTAKDKTASGIRDIKNKIKNDSVTLNVEAKPKGSTNFTVTVKGAAKAKGQNNYMTFDSLPTFGSAARGTGGTIGPKNKGGLTLTGEEGYEIAWIPSENRSMILGADGPQMVNLPNEAVVWTHEQSKKILKQKSIAAGSLGSGGGTYVPSSSNNTSNTPILTPTEVKKIQDNIKKTDKAADKVINVTGRVSVWWDNMTRRVDNTQHRADQNQTKLQLLLKSVGTTYEQAAKINNNFIAQQKRIISLANKEIKQADSELKVLDKGKKASAADRKAVKVNNPRLNTVHFTYDVGKGKKKKSKNGKVKTGKYIVKDGEDYVINQKEIAKVAKKNRSRAKAIAEAVGKVLDDTNKKRQQAEELRVKAQEAIMNSLEDIYQAFYTLDKAINNVYLIGQKLEHISSLQSAIDSGLEKEFTKAGAGFTPYDDTEAWTTGLQRVQDALNFSAGTLIATAKGNYANIDATYREFTDALNLDTYKDRFESWKQTEDYKKLTPEQIQTQSMFKEYNAAKELFKLLQESGYDGSNFDFGGALQALNEKNYTTEIYEKMKELLERIRDKRNNYVDAINNSHEAVNKIYATLQEYREYVAEFENDLISGLEEEAAAEIDKLDKLDKSLSKAMKDLLEGVKRKLDERRQKEDNQKTESELSQKQQRLAMLRADTAGGHAVEIAQLEKEIADSRRDYQRSLEDQLIEKLQNQADEAEKQRQKQIELLEAQKEIADKTGTNLEQVRKWMENPLDYREEIRKAWLANKNYDEVGENEQLKLEREFDEAWLKFYSYRKTGIPDLENMIATIDDSKTGFSIAHMEELLASIVQKGITGTGRAIRGETNEGFKAYETAKINAENSYLALTKAQAEYEANQKTISDNSAKVGTYTAQINDLDKQIKKLESSKATIVSGMSKKEKAKAKAKNEKIQKQLEKLLKRRENLSEARDKALEKSDRAKSETETDYQTYQQALEFYRQAMEEVYTKYEDLHLADDGYEPPQLTTGSPDEKVVAGPTAMVDSSAITAKAAQTEEEKIKKQNYNNRLAAIKKKGTISKGALTGAVTAGGKIGKTPTQVFNDIKKQKGISWNEILTAAKAAGYTNKKLHKMFSNPSKAFQDSFKKIYKATFASGGLADFTGPAWLDGTSSKPELVLNAQDTKNFMALKDVLSHVMSSADNLAAAPGDAIFEINVNVDHLNNDYDVDRVVERVKKKIVQDSSYRNVTQVRKFR